MVGSEELYIKLEEVGDITEIKLLKVKYKIFRVFGNSENPGGSGRFRQIETKQTTPAWRRKNTSYWWVEHKLLK